MAKIKFIQNATNIKDTKIIINDADITSSVRGIKINASAGNVTTVMLDIFPSDLEIECEDVKLTTDNFTIDDMLDALTDSILSNSKINYIRSELGKVKTEKMKEGDA